MTRTAKRVIFANTENEGMVEPKHRGPVRCAPLPSTRVFFWVGGGRCSLRQETNPKHSSKLTCQQNRISKKYLLASWRSFFLSWQTQQAQPAATADGNSTTLNPFVDGSLRLSQCATSKQQNCQPSRICLPKTASTGSGSEQQPVCFAATDNDCTGCSVPPALLTLKSESSNILPLLHI